MATQEQKKDYHVTKDFVGVNTKANRTAIKEEEFSWLENVMPIGHGNLRAVPAPTAVDAITFAHQVVHAVYGNISAVNYYIAFKSNGSCEAVNLATNAKTTVASAGTFSNSGVQATQWYNSLILIIDPVKGYFQWNGTTLVSVGSLSFQLYLLGFSPATYGILTGVSITGVGGTFLLATALPAGTLLVNEAVTISGTFGGTGSITGYTATTTSASYYITATNGTSTFTLSATLGGTAIVTTAGTPLGLTYTLTGAGYSGAVTATVAAPSAGGTQAVIALASNGYVITGVSANGTGLTPGTNYLTAPAVTITGSGTGQAIAATVVSQPGSCIASFSGRVWIANGRTLYYTAAGTNNDFASVSAGNIIFNDETLIGDITQIVAANNFLYVFGINSINVISDVRINTSTGATLYTNTNISAAVGSDLPYAMLPYFRSIVFMNRYGIYALVGSTTSKLSDALDGVFQYIDFTQPVSAGQVLLYNILCAAFSFTYSDPVAGARVIQAVFFDKKWFFTSQNSVKYMVSVPSTGSATLYSTTGLDLQRMYQSSTAAISTKIQPALLGMGNIIRDKQALKFGVEAILGSPAGNYIDVTVDSESASSPVTTLSNIQTIQWSNNSGSIIPWSNNAFAVVSWGNIITGYYLYRYDAQQWGKYIGLTITSTSPNFIVSGVQYQTELRASF
jgi:hypothetical protein